ncbi:hypothetical protein OR1_02729 [Geobacter sp. OR-1]|uniref:HNH endonuclease domain-containing protein n=1 Tax=Geobacter sp. OR-1 TaxID=1266765 RepID=UPI000542542E|nr:HNH endonuclease domain-containing protein [Geobacter sp. OR-1]GAM10440.1 hypothetical protein OR1_02729 [Geobacter sp. OR-1]
MADETRFYEIEPSRENYWRAIILFGRNVASYKFALAKALYDMRHHPNELIRMDELAPVFAKHIADHLIKCDKQATSSKSRFLDLCRAFNKGEITEATLSEQTVRLGFQNVIDAFHNVHGNEVPTRFFVDERNEKSGIRLTDDFFSLSENPTIHDLNIETEARWRLVETAWDLNVSRHVVQISHDDTNKLLHTVTAENRRVTITSSRDALNGYQKGRCFYCFRNITVDSQSFDLADVDHFFPYKLRFCAVNKPINGVANLVLACKECNRGTYGKFDRIPKLHLVDRLHRRNEYLIKSHHPLRETLMLQTGISEPDRRSFLQSAYNCSKTTIISDWAPSACGSAVF